MVAAERQLFTAGLPLDGQTARTLERPDRIGAAFVGPHDTLSVFHQHDGELRAVIQLHALVRTAQVQSVELDLRLAACKHTDAEVCDKLPIRLELDVFFRVIVDPGVLCRVPQIARTERGVVSAGCAAEGEHARGEEQVEQDHLAAGAVVGGGDDGRVFLRIMDEADRRTAVVLKALHAHDLCTSRKPEVDSVVADEHGEILNNVIVDSVGDIHAQLCDQRAKSRLHGAAGSVGAVGDYHEVPALVHVLQFDLCPVNRIAAVIRDTGDRLAGGVRQVGVAPTVDLHRAAGVLPLQGAARDAQISDEAGANPAVFNGYVGSRSADGLTCGVNGAVLEIHSCAACRCETAHERQRGLRHAPADEVQRAALFHIDGGCAAAFQIAPACELQVQRRAAAHGKKGVIAHDCKTIEHDGVLTLPHVDAVVIIVVRRKDFAEALFEVQLLLRAAGAVNILLDGICIPGAVGVAIVPGFSLIILPLIVAEHQHGISDAADLHLFFRACGCFEDHILVDAAVHRLCYDGLCVCRVSIGPGKIPAAVDLQRAVFILV